LLKEEDIIQKMDADLIRTFTDSILMLVCDPRLVELDVGKNLIRALNTIVIRICQHTNMNNCSTALLKLLAKYQSSEPNGRVIMLVRKCLVKHIEAFTQPGKHEQLDLVVVFQLMNEFFTRFHPDGQQIPEPVKESVKPLQAYLQRVVVLKRYKTLNYVYTFHENSVLVKYIRRCTRALGRDPNNQTTITTGSADETLKHASGTHNSTIQQQQNPSIVEELKSLFDRILKDIFDGSVEELYNLMEVHPEQVNCFEQFLHESEYSCLIRRAFEEIRLSIAQKKSLLPGEAVRRALPESIQAHIDHMKELTQLIDDVSTMFPRKVNGQA